MPALKPLYPQQAADLIGTDVHSIYHAIQCGTLPALSQANGRKRIRLEDLTAWRTSLNRRVKKAKVSHA